jgi:large subunit ribosomal protein L24
MQRLKTGDDVIVIAGKDKGRRGSVSRIVSEDRIVVEGINMAKKHVKPNPNAGVAGGIVEQEMPIHVSNVMLFNPETGKGDRVGFRWVGEGDARQKERFFKSTDKAVEV